jgi:hypothetical protein
MGSEDLNERDLEGGDLSVHEDSREIELWREDKSATERF